MRSALLLVAILAVLSACRASDSRAPGAASDSVARSANLPPSEENAKAVLETSPRHGELINIPLSGGTPLRTWIVYPERSDKAGVLLIIHEVFGLSDWIRGVADQLAREGFIAIAPDLISGFGPGGGGTDSVASRDDVVKLVRALTPAETETRLAAVRQYAMTLPAANGKLASIGFCWGGARSFELAASEPPPNAAVVFYGTSPDSARILRVTAPVQGHYGGDDARVNATIEPARIALQKLGRTYEPHIYTGAGHGFLRAQSMREGANLKASEEAWPRTIAFLRRHLE
jgi:carboxymethylenebutenolidase